MSEQPERAPTTARRSASRGRVRPECNDVAPRTGTATPTCSTGPFDRLRWVVAELVDVVRHRT